MSIVNFLNYQLLCNTVPLPITLTSIFTGQKLNIICLHVSLLFQVDAVVQSILQVEHIAHLMHSDA